MKNLKALKNKQNKNSRTPLFCQHDNKNICETYERNVNETDFFSAFFSLWWIVRILTSGRMAAEGKESGISDLWFYFFPELFEYYRGISNKRFHALRI